MARQNIGIGTAANDGTGDTLRVAGQKINENFAEVYELLGGDSGELSSGITLTDNGIIFEGTTVDDYETTLTAGNPSADVSLTLPTAGTEVVSNSATQTLTNKTLTSPVLTTPQINDTSADHQYVFAVSELTADRTVTMPLLTGNDEFVFKDHTQTLTNKTLTTAALTTPKITTSINDTNGAEIIQLTATGSAINHIHVTNGASGQNPSIAAAGDGTNIDLELYAKGTGGIRIKDAVVYDDEELTADGAMSLSDPLTVFNSSSALAITLPNGNHTGETKYFLNKGTATATITPTNLAGGSTVAVAADEAGFLIWSGSNWHLASKTSA